MRLSICIKTEIKHHHSVVLQKILKTLPVAPKSTEKQSALSSKEQTAENQGHLDLFYSFLGGGGRLWKVEILHDRPSRPFCGAPRTMPWPGEAKRRGTKWVETSPVGS